MPSLRAGRGGGGGTSVGGVIQPPPEVLDLFAVPDDVEPVPRGAGTSFRAGDLVLSPGRDAAVAEWLNPALARLSVRLDERPERRRRDLRVALPVPARDGSWVVDGWGATRHEPGATACRDLDVTLAAGRVLHAQLAATVRTRPPRLLHCDDLPTTAVVRQVASLLDTTDLGSDQLVHADLAGNVLLDSSGAPVVVDVVPAWGSVVWAEALVVLDCVVSHDAPRDVLGAWTKGARQQAMLRAVAWRARADEAGRADYEEVLFVVAAG